MKIIIEQNNILIRILKELIENLKDNQTKIVNEIRHGVIDKNKQVTVLEIGQTPLDKYPHSYKKIHLKALLNSFNLRNQINKK